ncbi:unnamed protein product [Protopolystoma xenopodis]|uniref:Uncharacterized protein n=1 Tax=Protopolystoma xenopodis TaxID=117903 RepID=A0A3S5CVP0_9PLAT|nr:unnamed protein product [Protopolystoma xenopodis]
MGVSWSQCQVLDRQLSPSSLKTNVGQGGRFTRLAYGVICRNNATPQAWP